MCDTCGCTPSEEPIEDEVCSVCGKPTSVCTTLLLLGLGGLVLRRKQ